MDANGIRSFGLSYGRGLAGWQVPVGDALRSTVEIDDCHRIDAVRLASRSAAGDFAEIATQANEVALRPALARDRFGNYVVWDAESGLLYSVSAAAGADTALLPVPVQLPDEAKPVRDLAMGADDVLYVAGADGVWLVDMRARFEPFLIAQPGFEAHRLGAAPEQGAWVLDVTNGRLARLQGLPEFTTGVDLLRERNERFEAVEAAPHPPKLRVLATALGTGERAVAVAACGQGAAILAVGPERARLRVLTDEQQWSAPITFDGPRFPHSFGFLPDFRFAVIANLVAQGADGTPQPGRDLGAFAYRLDSATLDQARASAAAVLEPLAPLGDYYPLTGCDGGPLVNTVPGSVPPLHFPRARQWTLPDASTLELPEPVPLARLSLAARAARGIVANFAAQNVDESIRPQVGLIDTGDATTVWHRLYLEASVPGNTAMIVWLAANDGSPPPFEADPSARAEINDGTWFPHIVGDASAIPAAIALPDGTPRAAWLRAASEVAGGQSLLLGERESGTAGLFDVLVQRAGRVVRALKGRRLWVAIELFGDGRATPELVAVRAYANRFSYRDQYLPALYHEQVYGVQADRAGGATGPDFLERFIDLFEGVFTSLEDRVANAHLVTDAAACPPEGLPWLGAWIGLALEDLETPGGAQRARNMLIDAPQLARRHGTLDGLRRALDIATDGGITRGRLVVVENFRLRRTMATILGADLVDENDPLTLGMAQSGNSFVGDSLFLGDENVKTFLALFRSLVPDPQASSYEARRQQDEREAAIHALYDGLAHRVTVLVHEAADPDELRRVRKLAADAAPAHVAVNVVAAKYPFLVAVASLVGVDTYLRSGERPDAVRLDISQLGYVDTLQGTGTLDAELGSFGPLNAVAPRPVADAGPDREVSFAAPFVLDGSASRAPPGRTIDEYRWRLLPPVD